MILIIMVWCAKRGYCEVKDESVVLQPEVPVPGLDKMVEIPNWLLKIVSSLTLKGQLYNIINNLTDIDLDCDLA